MNDKSKEFKQKLNEIVSEGKKKIFVDQMPSFTDDAYEKNLEPTRAQLLAEALSTEKELKKEEEES